ncbi:YihY/virulence factor BrkB family protein [Phytoactinopolyspora halotolerans]|uniref:YihY/virulence factor BrkB family protein n=1 Tax=Phytoactinopolyspora halotolerans TaxID=1981512 RepID=A0A6L9S180_9ACTN|nr:YihY/virulence factor BrkB family protein [Phytoactinopolyspora halotolerans]NED98756.1 YihY/virulence factor BrkB family protein [Phytoactinopolyspora halotolerans]
MTDRKGDTRSQAPTPEHQDKPDHPRELTKPSMAYIGKRTVREFSADRCTDLAAGLTYYAVLAFFPALVALVSLPALIGQEDQARQTLFDIVDDFAPASLASDLRGPIEQVTQVPGAGLGLVFGLAGALWAASGYVGAFARAMNRVYGIEEGRPFWKLRPAMLALTIMLILLAALGVVLLVVTGPLAEAIGNSIGLGSTAVTVWDIAKWPFLVVIVLIIVALLYNWTPNVRQPKFRWISPGAIVAFLVWAIASVGFAIYIANFANYDRTYGSLAGVIVFLLWLWITNLVLLFGAEFDAELERGRELQAGIAAEETIQLPPRDTRNIEKAEKKAADDVRRARELRERQEAHTGS